MAELSSKRGIVLGNVWVQPLSFLNPAAILGQPGAKQEFAVMLRPDFLEPVVRKCVLYFDEIEYPNNDFDPQDLPEIELLVQQNVVTRRMMYIDRSHMPVSAGERISAIRSANTEVFRLLDQSEPAKWSFAPLCYEPGIWATRNLINHQAIEIELSNMLPVPDVGVEYADILDFKHRRAPELQQLRAYMDKLFLGVIDSNDIPRAKIVALNDLDKALADVATVIGESGMRAFYRTVKISVLAGIDAAGRADLLGATPEYVKVAGLLSGVYTFAKTCIRSPVSRTGPLTYVHEAAKEGVVSLPV